MNQSRKMMTMKNKLSFNNTIKSNIIKNSSEIFKPIKKYNKTTKNRNNNTRVFILFIIITD